MKAFARHSSKAYRVPYSHMGVSSTRRKSAEAFQMGISHFAGTQNLRPFPWCGVLAIMLAVFFPCLLRAQTASADCGTVIAALKNLANSSPHPGPLDYPKPRNATIWGCYEQQAQQGDAMAEFIVGLTYYEGGVQLDRADHIKIPQDYVKARMWLEQAAGHFDLPTGQPIGRDSQFLLGSIYQYGKGTPVDLRKALAWYEMSAAHGMPDVESLVSDLKKQLSALPGNGSGVAAANGSGPTPSMMQPLSTQATTATVDVNAMLQNAVHQKVEFTSDEIKQIAAVASDNSASPYDSNDIQKVIRDCNDAAYVEDMDGRPAFDAAGECGMLAEWGMKSLGANNGKVELAYQRACAIPRAPGLWSAGQSTIFSTADGNFCAELGALYRQRNDTARALAVYESAPNCHAKGFQPAHPQFFETACPLDAEKILKAQAEATLKRCADGGNCSMSEINGAKQSDQEVAARIHEICIRNLRVGETIKCLGYMNQQEQLAAERYDEQMMQEAHERAKEQDEQRKAREEAHDANVNAFVSAIQSLPGGNDPNAIVSTAKQQAANMVAVGAANDAARAQAAAQRRLVTRASQQQLEQIAEQQGEAQAQVGSSAPSASASPASSSQEGTTLSGATAPQTGGSNNSGSGQYISPTAPSCIRMFNDSSMNGWVALQNMCSQRMTVTYVGKNGTGGVFGTMDLAPGQSDNTGRSPSEINAAGGIDWYPCPYGFIPTNMDGRQAVTTPVTEYTCKSRGY